LPPDLGERIRRLSLAEIVELGLRNNPATREAWANAQSAAAVYGSERGAWLPSVDGDVSAARLKTTASQGRSAVQQSVLTPSVTLSYLLFDFGGRSGRVEGARQRLLSAGFTQNATIQDVVLQIQISYFQYLASRALLQAQQTTLAEADTNLMAAEERRRVGVATIADVLQARTAVSQAQLNVQTTEGTLQTTRGALALALGLPANLSYDVDISAALVPVAPLADSVESIIAAALRGRPDLAAARAETEAAQAAVGEIRAAQLPSLSFDATAGRTYATTIPDGANSYSLSLGLTIPIFNGFSRQYDVRGARFDAEAAGARAKSLREQVVFQVFSSYYALQTATRRVRTAQDLIASADQASEVALGRYRAGVGTLLDLLAAQSALASARAQRVDARLSWSVSLAQLAHDAGVLDTRGEHPLRLSTDTHDDGNASMTRLTARRGLLALALVVSACRKDPTPVQPAVPVTAAVAERRDVPFELAATGTVEPIQTVAVQPQVSGPIVRIAFKEGQEVTRGQVLFEIDPRPFRAALAQAEAALARDKAQAANAEAETRRYSELASKDYVTAQQFEQVRTDAATATANLAGSKAAVEQAQLNLQYATIRAPIAGKTGSLRVREGNLVRSTDATSLVTINQIRPILARFAVPASNLPLIQRHRGETLAVRAAPVSGGTPVEGTWRSWTTRWIPPPGPSCSRGCFPTARGALAGRVRERAAPGLQPTPTRWWCRPLRWSRASREASCS
jgi:outer membrane protein TolC/biotin carboxyl carrier protein